MHKADTAVTSKQRDISVLNRETETAVARLADPNDQITAAIPDTRCLAVGMGPSAERQHPDRGNLRLPLRG